MVLKGHFRRHHPHGCSTQRQGAYVEILCEPFASRHFLPLCCWFACFLMFGKHDEIFLKYQLQGDRCGGCGLGTICRDLKRIDLPWPALTSQSETGSSTIHATLCDSCDRSWEATNGIGAGQAGQSVVATMLQRQAAWHSLIVLTWEWTGRDMLRLNLESFGNIAGWHLHLRLQGISLASASSAGYSEGLCLRFSIFSGSHGACRVYPHCNSSTRDKFSDLSISITCRSVTLQGLKRR